MDRSRFRPRIAILVALLCLASVAWAVEPNLVVVRATSLDALLADLERVGQAVSTEFSREQVLGGLSGSFGLGDLSWIDARRPVAVVYPVSGLASGANGVLAALPVRDAGAALAVLASLADEVTQAEDGTRILTLKDGTALAVLPRDAYLVVGRNPDLVRGLDLAAALDSSDALPGNLGLEVQLEPIAPMIMMGMGFARQSMLQRLTEAGGGESGDGEATDPDVDPETLQPFLDLYFGLIQDGLNNASRLDISLQTSAESLHLNGRVFPKSGSTLEGLIHAQSGGLPDLMRLVEPGGWAYAAGQIKLTPAFTDALRETVGGYARALKTLLDGQELQAVLPARMLELQAEMMEQALDCHRGDFVVRYDMAEQGGMSVSSVFGAANAEACATMLSRMGSLGRAGDTADAQAAGAPLPVHLEVTDGALEYRGVRAVRQIVSFDLPGGAEGDDEAQAALRRMLGPAAAAVTYTGLAGNNVLSVTGPDAEARFKSLVDRVQGKRAKKAPRTAAAFGPLQVGPGVFVAIDFAELMRQFAPQSGAEAAAIEEKLAGTGRIVYGLRFDATSLRSELALPLSLLRALSSLAAEDETGEPDPSEPEGEPLQGDAPRRQATLLAPGRDAGSTAGAE